MRKIFFTIFIFTVHCITAGDEVLSLDDCIRIGLEKNYALQIIRNQEKINDNNRTWGNAGFLPFIDVTAGYDGSLLNMKNKTTDGNTTFTNGIFNDGLNAQAELNWTLFDGFKMQAAYSKLKELQQMGKLRTRLSIEELVAQITLKYNEHIYQLLRLKNLKTAVDLSNERVRIVESRYEVGAASLLDLNQAKVDLNTDLSLYISQKEVVNLSIVNLNRLLANEKVDTPILLADSSINFLSIVDLETLRSKTLESNTDLLLAAKNVRLSELDKKAIRSRYFPYLNAKAGYGYGLNRYETGLTKESQSLGLNYGVTLGMNLFEGFNTKREMQNIRIEIENKALEEQNVRLDLIVRLSNTYLSYQNNRELYSMEQQNLTVVHEYYEAAIDKYKLGFLSGLELREAQQRLLEAEERLLLSRYNIKLCEISLKQLSGEIFSYLE